MLTHEDSKLMTSYTAYIGMFFGEMLEQDTRLHNPHFNGFSKC